MNMLEVTLLYVNFGVDLQTLQTPVIQTLCVLLHCVL